MQMKIASRLTGPVSKWIVVAVWLVLLVPALMFAGKLSGVQNNEAASWLPESAESTQALARMINSGTENDNSGHENDLPTVVVYQREGGLTPADLQTAKAHIARLQTLQGVSGPVNGPQVSPDATVAATTVTFNMGARGWENMPDTVKQVKDIVAIEGVKTYITGQGGQAADSAEAFSGLDSTLLFGAAAVVFLVLLIVYRSPFLLILPLPLIAAGVALCSAQAVVYLAARYADVTVNGQSQGILTVLVFGAGTDYALLLVARYREELRRHQDRHEAMAFALHRAAPAILASAATVVLGMLCLLAAELNSTSGLGPVAAIGVGVGMLVMITLLPALFVIVGRWFFAPFTPTYGSEEPSTHGLWSRLGSWVARRPRVVWITTTTVLAACCLGLLGLNANGLSTEDSYTTELSSVTGQKVLREHGLMGNAVNVEVISNAASGPAVADALRTLPGIVGVSQPNVRGGDSFIQAGMTVDPSSPEAFEIVEQVRSAVHAIPDANAQVGGGSALMFDVETASKRDNQVVIPLVLLAVLLVLMALLRAVVAPLLLIATVVLSFGATLGLSHLLFTHVFGFQGMDASLPLLIFVFLVALGIDYNIFLMTRVREEAQHHHSTPQAALVGLAATGGVITSAGLVLACTFLMLLTMPLVSFVQVGVAVALGVMLDTLIVRSVLVTALTLDVGRFMWWPSALGRKDAGGPAVVESTSANSTVSAVAATSASSSEPS